MEGRTECRAVGVIANPNVNTLAQALRGMCTKYGALELHEVVMRVPMDANNQQSTMLRLSRKVGKADQKTAANPFAEKPADRWLATHEGLPLRGPAVSSLPAAVREITESYCNSADALQFWKSLGGQPEYGLLKKGNEYICHHMGHELRVLLLQVLTLPTPESPLDTARNYSGKYVLDVTTRVAPGAHVEGCQALGSFGAKLEPLASLQPAVLNS
mmetsp:Transcript_2547/g.6535  ORF Transcript_2547/g.6535 Transcript_2547/m.6535 type:complete len:215 (-) Transcript_2547:233-877(-)